MVAHRVAEIGRTTMRAVVASEVPLSAPFEDAAVPEGDEEDARDFDGDNACSGLQLLKIHER